jgi:hypothetical protein
MDEPHRQVIGMTLADARAYLAGHGLALVVTRRDGRIVPDVDLTAPGRVLVEVERETIKAIEGRT